MYANLLIAEASGKFSVELYFTTWHTIYLTFRVLRHFNGDANILIHKILLMNFIWIKNLFTVITRKSVKSLLKVAADFLLISPLRQNPSERKRARESEKEKGEKKAGNRGRFRWNAFRELCQILTKFCFPWYPNYLEQYTQKWLQALAKFQLMSVEIQFEAMIRFVILHFNSANWKWIPSRSKYNAHKHTNDMQVHRNTIRHKCSLVDLSV